MAETPSKNWTTYNQEVLGKTWVLWRTEDRALSVCPWCTEVLVWPDLLKEAVTLHAAPVALEDLRETVISKLEGSLQVRAAALVGRMLRQEYPDDPAQAEPIAMPDIQPSDPEIVTALDNFTLRHPVKVVPDPYNRGNVE